MWIWKAKGASYMKVTQMPCQGVVLLREACCSDDNCSLLLPLFFTEQFGSASLAHFIKCPPPQMTPCLDMHVICCPLHGSVFFRGLVVSFLCVLT